MTERKTHVIDIPAARQELLSALREVHRRDRSRRVQAALGSGLRAGAMAFFGIAVVYGLWRVLAYVLAFPTPGFGPWAVLLAGALAVTAGLLFGPFMAATQRESLAAVAQRWDLAAGNQNRIATALELSRNRACGPFEAAAIRDGVLALEQARAVAPVIPRRRRSLRSDAFVIGCAILILAAAASMPLRTRERSSLPRRDSTVAEAPADLPGAPPTSRERPRIPERRENVGPEREGTTPRDPHQEPSANRESAGTTPGNQQRSTGRPGRGKNVEAQRARQASTAQGDPTEGASPSPMPEDRRPRETKPKKPSDPARHVPNPREKKEQTGATVGQSGAGGGAMSPVKSAWSQRDRSTDDPLPENPTDEPIEDEVTEDDARGGTQPTLKDRRAATSRDLSISGPGEGGDGRGGPTPQKKSRGTAALVLGVPVPDFVRGTLNPGTTKVTHERVEPVPSEAEPRAPVAVVPRRRPEPVVRPEPIPGDLRAALSRFFVRFHGAQPGQSP